MWAGDGQSLFFVSIAPTRRRAPRTSGRSATAAGSAPRQVTRFTDGRVLWPSATARGDAIVFERNFGIWKLDTAERQGGRSADHADGRARRTRRRAPAPDEPVPGSGAVARRQEGRVRGARRDLRRVGEGRRRRRARDDDGGPGVAGRVVAGQPQAGLLVGTDAVGRARAVDSRGCSHLRLRVRQGDAADDRRATATTRPRFSPDGKSIAFVRGGTELRVLDIDGEEGTLARQGHHRRPDPGRAARSPGRRTASGSPSSPPARAASPTSSIVPAAGGEAKPVSFLANANATGVAWSPDGTFLLFDTGQRTEVAQLARVDLILRTPKFREDQFRDLFNEEQAPRRPAAPTAPPTDEVSPKPPTPAPTTRRRRRSRTPRTAPNDKPTRSP